jgi:hypothetical protein
MAQVMFYVVEVWTGNSPSLFRLDPRRKLTLSEICFFARLRNHFAKRSHLTAKTVFELHGYPWTLRIASFSRNASFRASYCKGAEG